MAGYEFSLSVWQAPSSFHRRLQTHPGPQKRLGRRRQDYADRAWARSGRRLVAAAGPTGPGGKGYERAGPRRGQAWGNGDRDGGGISAAVSLVIAAFYKELLFTSYDATMSAASGIPVRLMQYLLPVLVGVTTVASLKAVGIVLVLALLVTPSATAMLRARRMPSIMAYSVAVGLLATVLGLYLSFYADLPSGPSIVLVATGLFLLALLFSPIKGVLWRRNTLASPSQEPAG